MEGTGGGWKKGQGESSSSRVLGGDGDTGVTMVTGNYKLSKEPG